MVLPHLDVTSAYDGLFSGTTVVAFVVEFPDCTGTGRGFCICVCCDPWGSKLTIELGGLLVMLELERFGSFI